MNNRAAMALALALVIGVGVVIGIALCYGNATTTNSGDNSGYAVPHGPIYIVGDNSFTPANGVNGGGSGTADDPYIIESWVIDASGGYGIRIRSTTKYFVIRNCLVENSWGNYSGIYLENVVNGKIENNTCSNNGGCGIRLDNSSYNNLTNNNCSNNDFGIYLIHSSNNTLSNDICSSNSTGISLHSSPHNNLTNNTCENNGAYGTYLYSSNYNNLTNNTCSYNAECGISLWASSSYNNLTNNTCENNYYGIWLESSYSNSITLNYLLNNTENDACQWYGVNSWDRNGHGNYWGDWQPPTYPDSNGDGIVDTPRPIAGGSNKDNYPLVLP